MAALIIILVLAFIGVLIAALMAGGSEKRFALEWRRCCIIFIYGCDDLFLQKRNQRDPLPSHTSLKLSFLSSCLSLR